LCHDVSRTSCTRCAHLLEEAIPLWYEPHVSRYVSTLHPILFTARRSQGKGASVDEKDNTYGQTALMFAAWNGHREIVEYLVVRGSGKAGTPRCACGWHYRCRVCMKGKGDTWRGMRVCRCLCIYLSAVTGCTYHFCIYAVISTHTLYL
jgi:hypothetical protein